MLLECINRDVIGKKREVIILLYSVLAKSQINYCVQLKKDEDKLEIADLSLLLLAGNQSRTYYFCKGENSLLKPLEYLLILLPPHFSNLKD